MDFKRFEVAFNLLLKDKCNIFSFIEEEEGFGIFKSEKKLVQKDIPCRVSYSLGYGTALDSQSDGYASELDQKVKIFLPSGIEILAGSEIEVIGRGYYILASIPRVYEFHQEIILKNKIDFA